MLGLDPSQGMLVINSYNNFMNNELLPSLFTCIYVHTLLK